MNIVIDRKKVIMFLVLILIIAVLAGVKFYVLPKMQADENSYSAVYLVTGEIYIGQLKTWPKMELNNAYLLQNVKDKVDPTKFSIQLTPVREALWSPKKVYLNEKNVVFYGPLEESSKAAEAIRKANETARNEGK